MGSGYRHQPTGMAGIAAEFKRIWRAIEASRSASDLSSAVIRRGGITLLDDARISSTADDGSATRLAGGMAEVQSAPDEPWVPITAQSEADAQAALDAAAQAVLDAAAAQDSADDKSTIVRSVLDAPTGPQPDYKSGDEWRKASGGFVTAVWQHDGTEFVSQVLNGTMLSADAIDGKTITGATLQTSATAARGVKIFSSGLIGYDAEGNPKTIVDSATGKITAVDGEFTGTVTGSAIASGTISIAEGIASTLDESFETATGTTPPAGWTRQVVSALGTGGGVDFVTSGGNPGRRMRLRTSQVPSDLGSARQVAYPVAMQANDFAVSFDYRWTGDTADPLVHELGLTLRARASSPGESGSTVLSFNLVNGKVMVRHGGAAIFDMLPPLAAGAWHRISIILRGGNLTIAAPGRVVQTYSLPLAPQFGLVAFVADTSGFYGAQTLNQTVDIDNVHIEALRTGLIVAPDGATTVEKLSIGAVGMAPDPMGPTDIVNLRSMLAVLPVTRVVASGAVGNTNASGYVTVPVSPALTGTPRAVNVLPNNSQLIGSCDLLNSSATSLRIYFRTITSAGAPVLASANPGQFSWTAFP